MIASFNIHGDGCFPLGSDLGLFIKETIGWALD